MKYEKGDVLVKMEYGRRVLGWVEPAGERYGFHYISRCGDQLISSGSSWSHGEEYLESPSTPSEALDAAEWRLTQRAEELRGELAYAEQGLSAIANVRPLLDDLA